MQPQQQLPQTYFIPQTTYLPQIWMTQGQNYTASNLHMYIFDSGIREIVFSSFIFNSILKLKNDQYFFVFSRLANVSSFNIQQIRSNLDGTYFKTAF